MIDEIKIENLIYNIRGKQVMIDSDLAKLYQCKNGTKSINLARKRNIERFPDDFCFQLTEEEYRYLRFQNETSSLDNYGGVRKLPYVFTEQGVAMLSSVLRTEIASKISINIMRAFVKMRKYLKENIIEQAFINEMVLKHEKDISLLQEFFNKLEESRDQIFFDGQIYDSYSKIIDIMSMSKEELIIIDNYADKVILDMISKLKVKVILITKSKSLLNTLDIEKYNKQYNNLTLFFNDTFHDRYFIIDKIFIYHLGSSINYIGSKTFSINKLEDEVVIKSLINKINNIFFNFAYNKKVEIFY